MEIEKIVDKLEFLEEWILHIDSDVKFHMTMQWTLIAVAVAIVGVALVIIAKGWFENRLDKELKRFRKEIIDEVTDYKTTTIVRDIAIQGVQIVQISKNKINAVIVKGYFIVGGDGLSGCKFIKDTLIYTKSGSSHDKIKLVFTNGGTAEVRVKGFSENGVELEWSNSGEINGATVGLDIMIF